MELHLALYLNTYFKSFLAHSKFYIKFCELYIPLLVLFLEDIPYEDKTFL